MVSIIDMNGEYKMQENYESVLPESLNVANYVNGTYMVVIQKGTNLQTLKFVKE